MESKEIMYLTQSDKKILRKIWSVTSFTAFTGFFAILITIALFLASELMNRIYILVILWLAGVIEWMVSLSIYFLFMYTIKVKEK